MKQNLLVTWTVDDAVVQIYPRMLPKGHPVARGSYDYLSSWATKLLNKEPAGAPKTYDSYGNSLYAYSQWRYDRIPCSFYTFETKTSNVCL